MTPLISATRLFSDATSLPCPPGSHPNPLSQLTSQLTHDVKIVGGKDICLTHHGPPPIPILPSVSSSTPYLLPCFSPSVSSTTDLTVSTLHGHPGVWFRSVVSISETPGPFPSTGESHCVLSPRDSFLVPTKGPDLG